MGGKTGGVTAVDGGLWGSVDCRSCPVRRERRGGTGGERERGRDEREREGGGGGGKKV